MTSKSTMSQKVKRGFTLIELLTVIGILGLLVLLAIPSFHGNKEKAEISLIKTDLKNFETSIEMELLKDPDFLENSEAKNRNSEVMKKMVGSGKVYSKEGPVEEDSFFKTNDSSFNYYIFNKSDLSPVPHSEGFFIFSSNGTPYFFKTSSYLDKDVPYAKDEDFKWIPAGTSEEDTYEAVGQVGLGSYSYIGKEKVVRIPNKIHGNSMTSYSRMFADNATYEEEFTDPSQYLHVEKIISDNPNIEIVSGMFSGSSFNNLDLSDFDLSGVKILNGFLKDLQVNTLKISKLDLSEVESVSYLFYGLDAIEVESKNLIPPKNGNLDRLFAYSELRDINSFFDSPVIVSSSSSMFEYSKIKNLNLKNFNFSHVKDMSYMFSGLETNSLVVDDFRTDSAESMDGMFLRAKIEEVDLEGMKTNSVTDMNRMFYYSNINNFDFSNFKTGNVKDMSYMFSGSDFKKLNLENLESSSSLNLTGMFSHSHVESLRMNSFDFQEHFVYSDMFNNSSLRELHLRNKTSADIVVRLAGINKISSGVKIEYN